MQQLLYWANQFGSCCFLNNHHYTNSFHSYNSLLAIGAKKNFVVSDKSNWQQLQNFIDEHKGKWLFGHFGYDCKNFIYPNLNSKNKSSNFFSEAFLFEPEWVIELKENNLIIHQGNSGAKELVQEVEVQKNPSTQNKKIQFTPAVSQENYVKEVQKILQHIQIGDCYELNYCIEFFREDCEIDPVHAYLQLAKLSPTPFGCFYKQDENYLLCSSPERFLRKQENVLIAQPIKGTIKRNLLNAQADALLMQQLQNSSKEKSENVMVVDLVRNDMSQVCMPGTVKANDLFRVDVFPQVHQLISTITGELKTEANLKDILTACFPMGSMTGAPKYKVMQLIEEYETTKRGIYSGSVGYINPKGNFDFNVVIRSLFYSKKRQYLSYMVGSGITHYCKPEQEYKECLLKAEALKKVFE